jgi:proteasome lid subunit RPN8/RPN11
MLATPPLRITPRVYSFILGCARAAGADECMGFLARRARLMGTVTAACRLPARVSPSTAEADPLAIKEAADALEARDLVAVGLWHSHGDHRPFHSETDDLLADRLLPALVPAASRPPFLPCQAPAAVGPDRAVLPLADGKMLDFVLRGPRIAGLDVHGPAAWSAIRTDFVDAAIGPHALFQDGELRLVGAGVSLALSVPEGATLKSRRVEIAGARRADLFSLVVNRRGETYAEVMTCHDINGETLAAKRLPCAIEVVGVPATTAPSAPRLSTATALPLGAPATGYGHRPRHGGIHEPLRPSSAAPRVGPGALCTCRRGRLRRRLAGCIHDLGAGVAGRGLGGVGRSGQAGHGAAGGLARGSASALRGLPAITLPPRRRARRGGA